LSRFAQGEHARCLRFFPQRSGSEAVLVLRQQSERPVGVARAQRDLRLLEQAGFFGQSQGLDDRRTWARGAR
jgi:hypothetical protein